MHSATSMHLPLSKIFSTGFTIFAKKFITTEYFILSFLKTWGCQALFCEESGAKPPGKWSFLVFNRDLEFWNILLPPPLATTKPGMVQPLKAMKLLVDY